ncbi:MAG: hypothetical protein E6J87_10300 [Deltaproteobacteria bacterium]|nr:MAG: hypothetical protein E6J87_10300 [Deltaproteobacteria bacterium]
MSARHLAVLALAAGAIAACTTVDVEKVPLCAPVGSLQPLPADGACDEGELAGYASAISELVVKPMSQALVRIEFDGGSRVRSLCVDQGVRNHAFHARRDIAPKLDAILARAPGPRCLAHKRIDLNRYQAKRAEIDEAERWCGVVVGERMTALQSCWKFSSDWILYDRVGTTLPYLYVKKDGAAEASDVQPGDTIGRCERTKWGFEAQSECILDAGYELLMSPEYELLTEPRCTGEGQCPDDGS